MRVAGSSRRSMVVCAVAVMLVADCRAFHNIVGLAQPVSDNLPLEPGAGTPPGQPVLVINVRDTLLAVGDTETVTGTIYISPVTRFSVPVGAYTDSSRRISTHDSTVVRIDGTLITGRAPGKAMLVMTGYSGIYVVGANLSVQVHPQ
jgi:hypothetical protein